jgi:hypothetical protein
MTMDARSNQAEDLRTRVETTREAPVGPVLFGDMPASFLERVNAEGGQSVSHCRYIVYVTNVSRGGHYSDRKAFMGSTRVADRAGT